MATGFRASDEPAINSPRLGVIIIILKRYIYLNTTLSQFRYTIYIIILSTVLLPFFIFYDVKFFATLFFTCPWLRQWKFVLYRLLHHCTYNIRAQYCTIIIYYDMEQRVLFYFILSLVWDLCADRKTKVWKGIESRRYAERAMSEISRESQILRLRTAVRIYYNITSI